MDYINTASFPQLFQDKELRGLVQEVSDFYSIGKVNFGKKKFNAN